MTKTIVIVDGYSTSRELVKEINRHGGTCVHIRSVEKPPVRLAAAFDASPYSQDLGYLGPLEVAAQKIHQIKPIAVVAGSEPGVEYAEALASLVGLPTNRPELAKARRNKFDMAKAIESAGLAGARQEIATSGEEAVAWARSQGSWPIVVKPVDSAGSDGVVVCHDLDEVRAAAEAPLNRENLLGLNNSVVLVQTYIDGEQYIVNVVSTHGRHTLTDVWKMTLRPVEGYSNVMEDWFLLDPNSVDAKVLTDYTFKVLDALGIENGPSVSEVRLTRTGPALIETGARLNGPAMDREPYIDCGLKGTQATAFAQQLVAPEMFASNWGDQSTHAQARWFAKSFFIFKARGVVRSVDGLKMLGDLPSFHSHLRPLSAGDQVALTTDTVGRGGVVYWIADDEQQLHENMRQFHSWDDNDNLYEITYS